MKRSFVVACALALTLALGLSAGAGAGVSAEASAKSAKKGKSCKGKAGKSTAATAQAAKKGKKKSCKAKGKGTQPAAAALSDGSYGDAANKLELTISNGAKTVAIDYTPPGGCATISYTSEPVSLTKSGDAWAASETRPFNIGGAPATAQWDLTVKSELTYALNLTLQSESAIFGSCKWEGHATGTLTKAG